MIIEKKRSDYMVDMFNEGKSEQEIFRIYLERGIDSQTIHNSLSIAKHKLANKERETLCINLNHLPVSNAVTPKQVDSYNINNQRQEQSVKQSYQPIISTNDFNINNPSKSRMVSIRLPMQLYEFIKDKPSGKIKEAIKNMYIKTDKAL